MDKRDSNAIQLLYLVRVDEAVRVISYFINARTFFDVNFSVNIRTPSLSRVSFVHKFVLFLILSTKRLRNIV